MKFINTLLALLCLVVFAPGCGDVGHDDHDDHDHHGHDHDPNEVMTTIRLNFTAESGGEPFTATWADANNDGNAMIDTITLTAGETYAVTVEVLNELEDPAENVTEELQMELDEHQFFFYGEAISSPSSESTSAIVNQSYSDMDSVGFPVGLTNSFEAVEAGSGMLTIMLRHMPPVNGTAVKTGELAEMVKSGNTDSLPGSIDIQIDFPITVQ